MTATRPVALVTGASSGIGKAAALALAAAGFQVTGTSRNTSRVTPRDGVMFLDLDVTSDEPASAVVQQVTGRFGRIGVLASNAGAGAAEESSVAQAQGVFDVNVFGLMRMTKAVLPHMRARERGRIINISSVLGFIPAPYMAVYAASKHAVEGYSESLDHEVREHGIGVLLVQPAVTSTPFDANMVQADTPLPAYAQQRRIFGDVMAAAMKDGDDPAIVSRVIVVAATGLKPGLRYTAGPAAGRVSNLRRVFPPGSSTSRSAGSTGWPASGSPHWPPTATPPLSHLRACPEPAHPVVLISSKLGEIK
jgi:NAD(P)-dependent dehydrogenase (short-subunit alcohol dehydrogenase family)